MADGRGRAVLGELKRGSFNMQRVRIQKTATAGVALAAVAVLAACSSSGSSTSSSTGSSPSASASASAAKLSGTLNGSGSTFQTTYQQAAIQAFKAEQAGLTVNYGGGGSGKGRTDLASGVVNFAGSGSPVPAQGTPDLHATAAL